LFHVKQSKMKNTSKTGLLGENLACQYLLTNKYAILERNFRMKFGELDIIAVSKDGILVCFEVKTSSGFDPVLNSEDQMTKSKIAKTKRIAEMYANQSKHVTDKGWRIDLLAVQVMGDECRIRHYENI